MDEYERQMFDIWAVENPSVELSDIRCVMEYEEAEEVFKKLFLRPSVQFQMWLKSTGLDKFLAQFDDDDYEKYCSSQDDANLVLARLKEFMENNDVNFQVGV